MYCVAEEPQEIRGLGSGGEHWWKWYVGVGQRRATREHVASVVALQRADGSWQRCTIDIRHHYNHTPEAARKHAAGVAYAADLAERLDREHGLVTDVPAWLEGAGCSEATVEEARR